MNVQEILTEVRRLAAAGALTREKLLAAYEGDVPRAPAAPTTQRRVHVAEILYFIGGTIVFLGVVVLVSQNWDVLSAFTQIIVTLGSSIAAFVVGTLFSQYPRLRRVGTAFYLLSALLAPLGLSVTFGHAGYAPARSAVQSAQSGILFIGYFLGRLLLRRQIFTFFSIVFGTWLFYSFLTWVVRGAESFYDTLRFYEYLTLVAGLTFLLLGYGFRNTADVALKGPLYGFGLFGFFSAALALGGWTPNQHVVWELLFPGLVFGSMFASIPLRSRAFLILGALFLIAYISKITAEYFQQSIGWPFALVLIGLSLIAVGYATYALHRKYLARTAPAV